MAREDTEIRGAGEAFFDPGIVLAPDLALVEIGLRGVDRDERDLDPARVEAEAGVAAAERLLEADVANVARVVVPRDEDDSRAIDRGQFLLRDRILVGVTVVGDVTRDHDQVGRRLVDLTDRSPQQGRLVAAPADVDVRELRDQHYFSSGSSL